MKMIWDDNGGYEPLKEYRLYTIAFLQSIGHPCVLLLEYSWAIIMCSFSATSNVCHLEMHEFRIITCNDTNLENN